MKLRLWNIYKRLCSLPVIPPFPNVWHMLLEQRSWENERDDPGRNLIAATVIRVATKR